MKTEINETGKEHKPKSSTIYRRAIGVSSAIAALIVVSQSIANAQPLMNAGTITVSTPPGATSDQPIASNTALNAFAQASVKSRTILEYYNKHRADIPAIQQNHFSATPAERIKREAHSMFTIFGGVIFLWVAVGILSLIGRQPGDKILLESMAGRTTAKVASGGKKKTSSPSDSSSSGGRNRINQSRELMQCALDQASQAESAAARASSGNKSSKLSAASSAQNYANAARGWADRAASCSSGGPLEANEAAITARNAANRAQAAADRAKYNAAIA